MRLNATTIQSILIDVLKFNYKIVWLSCSALNKTGLNRLLATEGVEALINKVKRSPSPCLSVLLNLSVDSEISTFLLRTKFANAKY